MATRADQPLIQRARRLYVQGIYPGLRTLSGIRCVGPRVGGDATRALLFSAALFATRCEPARRRSAGNDASGLFGLRLVSHVERAYGAARLPFQALCDACLIEPTPLDAWRAVQTNDCFAAAVAALLLHHHGGILPPDLAAGPRLAWACYAAAWQHPGACTPVWESLWETAWQLATDDRKGVQAWS